MSNKYHQINFKIKTMNILIINILTMYLDLININYKKWILLNNNNLIK
jgi:hypothetical protein